MIEALLVLLFVIAGCWLLLAVVWFLFKLCFWAVALTVGAIGGALLSVLLLPFALLFGLVLLPMAIVTLLPWILFGGLLWWLVRDRPRRSLLR